MLKSKLLGPEASGSDGSDKALCVQAVEVCFNLRSPALALMCAVAAPRRRLQLFNFQRTRRPMSQKKIGHERSNTPPGESKCE